ncbi:MAG TPA: hypothetical protein VMY37_04335 [Thermoguttaceae bacterium]|nr:hypothetical protein [Thermoguttaceae bacterium]
MATIVDYQTELEQRPNVASYVRPRWTAYIPHDPTPKQMAFLSLDGYREAFYGGAAGGGKSDALLMAALQYVDVPEYSALILRKSYADLTKAGALIDRAHSWLDGTDARWSQQEHTWHFPNRAKLAFGYLDADFDYEHFQSAEYQYIAADEITQLYEEDYIYVGLSRLRRLVCSRHGSAPDGEPIYLDDCPECQMRRIVPCRLRSASNPGGRHHVWVRKRFRIGLAPTPPGFIERIPQSVRGLVCPNGTFAFYRGQHPARPHVPAFVWDNPYIDQRNYIESLGDMASADPVTCAQLLRGDWGVTLDGRIKKAWARYYRVNGDYIVILGHDGKDLRAFHVGRECRIFQTVDPAASAREGPGDKDIWKREASWTVISTWVVTPHGDLCWWDVDRSQCEVPDVISRIKGAYAKHLTRGTAPEFIGIEPDGLGIGVFQLINRTGLPTRALRPRSADKLVCATDFINRMKEGKVFLPEEAPWLEDCESELFTWTAHPKETADQIDTAADAAQIVSAESAPGGVFCRDDLPSVEAY